MRHSAYHSVAEQTSKTQRRPSQKSNLPCKRDANQGSSLPQVERVSMDAMALTFLECSKRNPCNCVVYVHIDDSSSDVRVIKAA